MVHVNEAIRDTVRVFPMQGRYGLHRYDMNENPEGLPKEFVDSVLAEITPEYLAIYPEPDRFLRKYADFIGVDFENVLATNGSDMAIRYIMETFGERGKDVVTVSPTFEMYWVNCCILGYNHVPVPYNDDLTIDVDRIVAAITPDTRIVSLLNPNNPVGNVFSADEVERIIDAAEAVDAVVVIDEAYHYFCDVTYLDFALSRKNVILLRTFSKCFSIAGCRLGIVISCPELIHYVSNAKLTFDANSIALLFGERLLDHPEILEQLIAAEKEGKAYTLAELEAHGYETHECAGNYIFVTPRRPAKDVLADLEARGVLVHGFGKGLLEDRLRVSVGSKAAMQIFLDAFFEVDGPVG